MAIVYVDHTPIMLQPGGYLTKEVTGAQILEELQNLRDPAAGIKLPHG